MGIFKLFVSMFWLPVSEPHCVCKRFTEYNVEAFVAAVISLLPNKLKGEGYGLTYVPSKRCVAVLPSVSQNVALFENRVFADGVKLK